MDALMWAILTAAAAALGLLYLCSPQHAQAALRTAAALWIGLCFVALPLLLRN